MSVLAFIFAFIGAVLGAAIDPFEGFFFGGILGFLTGAFIDLKGKFKLLEKRLNLLSALGRQKEVTAAMEETTTVQPAEAAPTVSAATTQPSDSNAIDARPDERAPAKPADKKYGTTTAYEVPRFERAIGNATEYVKLFFTTGNLVVRIGIIVLFFGVAFLLKYAADHSVLSIEIRLMGAALGGIALLVVGWRLRHKRLTYALLLQGGAIGVLYLTVFSAAKFYTLVPLTLALGIMIGIVVLSGVLAVLQNAKSLAVFGAAGGFLAPVLLSTGAGNHVVLFTYYALLNAGIFGIAWYKSWRELNLVGFVFTFVIGTFWGVNNYRPEHFATTEPFLILFFLFFVAISVLFAFRQPPQLKGYVDSSLVFGVPIIGFALQAAIVKDYEYGMAISALAVSGLYIALAFALWQRRSQGMRMLTEAFLALGVVFGSLAIPLALDGRWTAAAWALEGAALVWVGIRQQRLLSRNFGLVLQLSAGVIFLEDFSIPLDAIPVFNGFYIGCLAVSFAGLFSAYYLQHKKEVLKNWEGFFPHVMFIWGLLWWFGSGLNEIAEHVINQYEYHLTVVFLALSCLAASQLKRRLDWSLMRFPALALGLMLVFIIPLIFVDSSTRHPLANFGYIVWPLTFMIQYIILKGYDEATNIQFLRWHHALTLWIITFIITWEASWSIDKLVAGAGTWSFIAWGIIPGIMVMALSSWGKRIVWPVGKHYADYLSVGLAPITAYLLVWTLFTNITMAGDPWPISYIPLINPLDLAIAFTLLAMLRWGLQSYRHDREAHIPFISTIPARYLTYALAGSVFVWFNGILARSLHHWQGVPFNLHSMLGSMEFQAAISVMWSVLALAITVWATKKRNREVWFAGAALLISVVVKLFAIDLSSSGTVERIVSFLVVGLLMLVIGYFSPLPPRKQQGESS